MNHFSELELSVTFRYEIYKDENDYLDRYLFIRFFIPLWSEATVIGPCLVCSYLAQNTLFLTRLHYQKT